MGRDAIASDRFNPRGASCPRSEPHVRDAAAVARQVVEGDQAFEMIDGQMRNRAGLGEPQVDGDAPTTPPVI